MEQWEQELPTVMTQLFTLQQAQVAAAGRLITQLQILAVVAAAPEHKWLPLLLVPQGKETTAEQHPELTLAAVAVVRALSEAMRSLALLAVLVVPEQHGRKMVWTTQAAEAVVVNKLLVERLAALVVAVTAQTQPDLQQSRLPEMSTLAAAAVVAQLRRALQQVAAAS